MQYCFLLLLTIISWQLSFSYQFPEHYHSINADQYVNSLYQQTDRQYYPLTEDMCKQDDEYKFLKSCDLYVHNRHMLTTYSQQFLNRRTNYWARSSTRDTVNDVEEYYHKIYALPPTYSYTYQTNNFYTTLVRRKRSTSDIELDENQNGDIVLNRSKRDIPGNPCVTGREKRTVIFYALDAYNDTPRELLQDVENKLYQSFYTRECHKQRFEQFNCEITYVTHLAAVFDDYGDVIIRPVRIPTSCAMIVN